MSNSEEIHPNLEFDFIRETVKRDLIKHPNSALLIALQLLRKIEQQHQKQTQLEQQYDELLTSYLNINNAYLASLRLLRDNNLA